MCRRARTPLWVWGLLAGSRRWLCCSVHCSVHTHWARRGRCRWRQQRAKRGRGAVCGDVDPSSQAVGSRIARFRGGCFFVISRSSAPSAASEKQALRERVVALFCTSVCVSSCDLRVLLLAHCPTSSLLLLPSKAFLPTGCERDCPNERLAWPVVPLSKNGQEQGRWTFSALSAWRCSRRLPRRPAHRTAFSLLDTHRR